MLSSTYHRLVFQTCSKHKLFNFWSIVAREPPKKPSYNAIEEPKAGKLPLGDNKAIKAALTGVPFGLSPVEVYPPYLPDNTNQNSIAVIFSEDPVPNSPPRPRVKKSFLARMMEKLTKP